MIDNIIRDLPRPNYVIESVPNSLNETERMEKLSKNYDMRVNYIHNSLTKRFPEIGSELTTLASSDKLTKWAEVLVEPDERIILEALKVRAVSHEQRPPKYVALGLTDIDYFETNSSLVILKEKNKAIETEVSSKAFREKSSFDKKKRLKELSKERDEAIHPLVFVLSLNVDDLDKDAKRKLRLLHALGKHEDARKSANSLLTTLQKEAIAEIRQCQENNVLFNKMKYRNFS